MHPNMTDSHTEKTDVDTDAPTLSAIEARVLGCLMEKQRTTPDTYPLTLNALVQACNQKSSRSPVMSLEPGEVGRTVHQLRDRELIRDSFTGRSERYEHRMTAKFRLGREHQALMCVLMLRGPQTIGELRTHSGRMAEFANLDAVAETLLELAERRVPLVVHLPRLPGKREERYGQLLCGPIEQEMSMPAAAAATEVADSRDQRIAALESQVAALTNELRALWQLTGLADQRPGAG